MTSAFEGSVMCELWGSIMPPQWQDQDLKLAPDHSIVLGKYIRPPHAQLKSILDEALEIALAEIWSEIGPCLGSPKADGWRIQIHKKGQEVILFSRSETIWTEVYPSVADMIRARVKYDQVILDTELVGFDKYGRHLEPSKLLHASRYHCYVLDALYLDGRNLIFLPTHERNSLIKEQLRNAFCEVFSFAEYSNLDSLADLISFYQRCRERRKEGFDGAILKRLDTPYFTEILKLKPEDTTDAVIIGAYRDEKGRVQSLLLAVLSYELKLWVPVAKVTRTNTDWDIIWTACQPFIVDHRPPHLDEIPEIPDIWITPQVVVEITMTELHPGKGYLVRAEYPRKCTLREDKGYEDATSLEQILQTAGLTETMKTLSERAKRQQLNLFEDSGSVASEFPFIEDEEALYPEKTFSADALIQKERFNNEGLIQLRLGLFE